MNIRRILVDPISPDDPALAHAVDVLAQGAVVAYPTDTLYALAVDPRSDEAVERLFRAKGRDANVAVPLIAGSIEQAQEVAHFDEQALALAREFWPGPLTLVLQPRARVSHRILGGGTTLALRVPAHAIARSLAARFGFCITATSANRSGDRAAATADEAAEGLGEAIDLLLDGGPAPGGLPSTIVEIASGRPRLVRAGSVAWERVLRSLE